MSNTQTHESLDLSREEALKRLRKNPMMRRLADALEDGQDIGHYGRFTFATVARHFMEPRELARYLAQDRDEDLEEAMSLVHQVNDADYNPPGPAKIRAWDREQSFQILPGDHRAGDDANVYQDLDLPDHVYEKIRDFHKEQAKAEMGDEMAKDIGEQAGDK